jgi:beta-lactamase class D
MRSNRLFRLTIGLILGVCWFWQSSQLILSMPSNNRKHAIRANTDRKTNFDRHFRELGVKGSIVIYDMNKNRTFQHNPSRNDRAFLPASTFKILNSLIALETKVVLDENYVFTWDGITRIIPEWNRDLKMKEAMKYSAVWFYQVIARRIGYDRMKKSIVESQYGNQEIGSKEEIDKFWLEGKLRISPQQQIQFLRRFYNNELPFSPRSMAIVKNIIIMERTPNYIMRGKTGWVNFDGKISPQIGWYVGYLEQGKNVYFFATNIDIKNKKDATVRVELTRRCLKDIGLL